MPDAIIGGIVCSTWFVVLYLVWITRPTAITVNERNSDEG
jgi:hypothetical protein